MKAQIFKQLLKIHRVKDKKTHKEKYDLDRTSGYSNLFIINPGMNLKEIKKKYPLKLRIDKNKTFQGEGSC